MTPKERTECVFGGGTPDRLPNFNIIMGFSAMYSGKTYREYASDYKTLCECDMRCAEDFGLDILSAISDPMREAESFGAQVNMPENDVPYSPVPLITDLSQVKTLHAAAPENPAAPAATPAAASAAAPPADEDYMVNERDINYYWQEYAGQLPQEQVALAKRMRNVHLTLLNDHTCEAVVDNPIVAKEFTDETPVIQEYLRTHLKNRKIALAIRVSAPKEQVRVYGRNEQFQMMSEKNTTLLDLQNEFGLEFM